MRAMPAAGKMLLCVLLCAAMPFAAGGATLGASAARVAAGPAQLEGVRLSLAWPEGASEGELRITASTLALDDLGYRFERPAWRCRLTRDEGPWRCRGEASASVGTIALDAALEDEAIAIDARRERTRLRARWPLAEGPVPVEAVEVPARWLQPLLAAAWPEAAFNAGAFDASLQLELSPGLVVEGEVAARGLGLDTIDGRIAAAGLGFSGPVRLELDDAGTRARATLALRGGELLAGSLYAALPGHEVRLDVAARGAGDEWRVERLAWDDPGAFALDASGRLRLDADQPLREASIRVRSDDLAAAAPRYLESLLATAGLPGLELAGRVEAGIELADGAPVALQLQAAGIDAGDGAGRFAVAGLDGRIDWATTGQRPATRMAWDAAAMHGVALGAADLALASGDGRMRLAGPASLALMGGSLELQRLSFDPFPPGPAAERFSLSLELRQLELAQLSAAFGWPALEGRLSGLIPAAHYRDGVLTFDGGLTVDVFDGRVAVSALSLERPFGVAPTLAADILLSRLDLEPLTAAFGFGTITGRLEGRVAGLRLVDWSPVAFDADFHTSTSDTGKRRISRRAVRELSEVGGSGFVGGLQDQIMRMFETFPYEQIGLSCRLSNNVCAMGGLESRNGGYTIVEGAGLPRITVVGFQRNVDWPVLLARLEAAGRGQAPVID